MTALSLAHLARTALFAVVDVQTQSQDSSPGLLLPGFGEYGPLCCVGLILGFLILFGAFGGILAALSNVPIPEIIEKGMEAYGGRRRLAAICVLGALWGAGGALALGVVLSLDQKFRELQKFDGEKSILIACAAVAAGFSGIRMLKLVSRDLENKVNEAAKKADEAKHEAEHANRELVRSNDKSQQLASALTFAGEVLSAIANDKAVLDPVSLGRAIFVMEQAYADNPSLRIVGIYLGRLYKFAPTEEPGQNYDKAIGALTRVYDSRRREGMVPNPDDGALLFNRACYANLLARVLPAQRERIPILLTSAQRDLDEAIRLDGSNRQDAAKEPDLQGLRGGPSPA